jgi:nucleoside-diphosphate-sugar epimerase
VTATLTGATGFVGTQVLRILLARAYAAAGGKRCVGVGTCFEYELSSGLMATDTPFAPNTLYPACKAPTFQVLRCFFDTAYTSLAWCRIFYLYGEGEDEGRLVPYIRKQPESGQEVLLTGGDRVRDFLLGVGKHQR